MGGGLNRRFLDVTASGLAEETVLGLGGDDDVVVVADDVTVVEDGTGEVDRTLSLMEGPPPPPSGLSGDGMG